MPEIQEQNNAEPFKTVPVLRNSIKPLRCCSPNLSRGERLEQRDYKCLSPGFLGKDVAEPVCLFSSAPLILLSKVQRFCYALR